MGPRARRGGSSRLVFAPGPRRAGCRKLQLRFHRRPHSAGGAFGGGANLLWPAVNRIAIARNPGLFCGQAMVDRRLGINKAGAAAWRQHRVHETTCSWPTFDFNAVMGRERAFAARAIGRKSKRVVR